MENNTITITVDEYRSLIIDSVQLAEIKKYAKTAKYSSDVEEFVHRVCFDEAEEEGDAE